jgi:hypothetical protein
MSSETQNIDDMTFTDICEQVRQDYSTLPDSSFESPDKLLEALEALSKNTAGYSHIFNAREYRVLDAAVHLQHTVFTTRDLSEKSGLPLKSVQDCISIWNKYHYKYLTKLQKRTSKGENRSKLRKWGARTYLDMKNRIKHNFSLNRQKYIPEKVDSYFVINKYGKLMGLTEADLPKSL